MNEIVIRGRLIRNTMFLVSVLMVGLFAVNSVFAQESSGSAEPSAKKYNIVFPVSTLGNCADLASCKAYCADEANKDACVNFAKTKGFYKAPAKAEGTVRTKLLIEKAKSELGCDTEEACRAFCQDEANSEKCSSFAKKYGINNNSQNPVNKNILDKAKAALGCTTEETCKALCKEEKNREICSNFAKKVGLPGGLVKVASGSGQNKEGYEQVRKIIEKCKENPEACKENIDYIEGELNKRSDEYCKTNPDKCKELEREFKKAKEGGGKKASGSGELKKNVIQNKKPELKKPEIKKIEDKKQENQNKQMGTQEKVGFVNEYKIVNPEVQGVSTSPSILDRIFSFFFN